jgi:hypothetical protein
MPSIGIGPTAKAIYLGYYCRMLAVHNPTKAIVRQMPPRSEKHANFRRLAQARTESVREALRKLANLSSPNYEFTDAEVERIFSAIERGVDEARGRFRRDLTKRSRFTLEDL